MLTSFYEILTAYLELYFVAGENLIQVWSLRGIYNR